MNDRLVISTRERRQGRAVRIAILLSLLFHLGVVAASSGISAIFPSNAAPVVVTVELTELPVSELPEVVEPPPQPVTATEPPAEKAPNALPKRVAPPPPDTTRWLRRLETRLASVSQAPVSRSTGKEGIAVRRWRNEGIPKPGDFAPAVAPESRLAIGKLLADTGDRLRANRPTVGTGEVLEGSIFHEGAGSEGDPVPDWVRDMIRSKVRSYLPDLEERYSVAYRNDSSLAGRVLVRFRIHPTGRVVLAEKVQSTVPDPRFVQTVLDRVREWSFDPTDGRPVEVLYPFVFVAPS